jgi:hypothetical protein
VSLKFWPASGVPFCHGSYGRTLRAAGMLTKTSLVRLDSTQPSASQSTCVCFGCSLPDSSSAAAVAVQHQPRHEMRLPSWPSPHRECTRHSTLQYQSFCSGMHLYYVRQAPAHCCTCLVLTRLAYCCFIGATLCNTPCDRWRIWTRCQHWRSTAAATCQLSGSPTQQ